MPFNGALFDVQNSAIYGEEWQSAIVFAPSNEANFQTSFTGWKPGYEYKGNDPQFVKKTEGGPIPTA